MPRCVDRLIVPLVCVCSYSGQVPLCAVQPGVCHATSHAGHIGQGPAAVSCDCQSWTGEFWLFGSKAAQSGSIVKKRQAAVWKQLKFVCNVLCSCGETCSVSWSGKDVLTGVQSLAVATLRLQAVDVVGQAGKPKTITGFQTHTTPVLLAYGERAELATEECILALVSVLSTSVCYISGLVYRWCCIVTTRDDLTWKHALCFSIKPMTSVVQAEHH